MEQAGDFESDISAPSAIIFLEAAPEVLTERLIGRGNFDDNKVSARNRKMAKLCTGLWKLRAALQVLNRKGPSLKYVRTGEWGGPKIFQFCRQTVQLKMQKKEMKSKIMTNLQILFVRKINPPRYLP